MRKGLPKQTLSRSAGGMVAPVLTCGARQTQPETMEETMTLQDTEARLEFLKKRQAGVGGSDVGALLGVDPWKNAYDVYLEKTRPPTPDQANSIHLLRGVALESMAADLYAEDTGRKVRRVKQRSHPDYPWAVVNVDRQILRSNGRGTGAMEIKAPATPGFQRLLDEGAQSQHTVQLMWAMYVLGYDWGEYVAINLEHNNGPVIHFPLERNEDLIDGMAAVADKFWHEHVEKRVPPIPENWPYFHEPMQVPEVGGSAHVIKTGMDKEWDAAYAFAIDAHKELKAAEDTYELAKAAILELAGDLRMKVTGEQGSVSTWWNKGRDTFNDKLLRTCGPLDPDKVRMRFLDEPIDELIAECALDLTPFIRTSDAYQVVRTTPKKKKEAS